MGHLWFDQAGMMHTCKYIVTVHQENIKNACHTYVHFVVLGL